MGLRFSQLKFMLGILDVSSPVHCCHTFKYQCVPQDMTIPRNSHLHASWPGTLASQYIAGRYEYLLCVQCVLIKFLLGLLKVSSPVHLHHASRRLCVPQDIMISRHSCLHASWLCTIATPQISGRYWYLLCVQQFSEDGA